MKKMVINILGVIIIGSIITCSYEDEKITVKVDWDRVIRISESSSTIQTIPCRTTSASSSTAE